MALIEGHIEDNGDVDGEDDDSVGGHITTPLPLPIVRQGRTVLPVTKNLNF